MKKNMCTKLEEIKSILIENPDQPKSVAIMVHPYPDPDCIGAAKGMEKLLKYWNPSLSVNTIYDGEISHPQNKTLMKVLNISMTHRDEVGRTIADLKKMADYFIVVDCMPERCDMGDIVPLAVIDHHPVDTKNAQYKDIRQVGSCCTMVWEYLKKENVPFDEKSDDDASVATAMLVGLKTDTMDLISEKTVDLDFSAFKDLLGNANKTKLASIINYPIPSYLFELRARLDKDGNTKAYNGVYIGGIGYISAAKRDALPTIAEERARTEGIDTSFIFGIVGDKIEVCIRSNSPSVDVKNLCHQIFGREHGGGHPRAGAVKIPIPLLSDENTSDETKDAVWNGVRSLVMEKIEKEIER
jgi:nanoRNase/pAp phosphatase (c-di-AMP/oligoRNAs hydrolase)